MIKFNTKTLMLSVGVVAIISCIVKYSIIKVECKFLLKTSSQNYLASFILVDNEHGQYAVSFKSNTLDVSVPLDSNTNYYIYNNGHFIVIKNQLCSHTVNVNPDDYYLKLNNTTINCDVVDNKTIVGFCDPKHTNKVNASAMSNEKIAIIIKRKIK